MLNLFENMTMKIISRKIQKLRDWVEASRGRLIEPSNLLDKLDSLFGPSRDGYTSPSKPPSGLGKLGRTL